MQSIGPFGATLFWLIPLMLFATIIYGIIQVVRTLKQISRDLSEINETLRHNRSTPTIQE